MPQCPPITHSRSRCLVVGAGLLSSCASAAWWVLPTARAGTHTDSTFAEALSWLMALAALPALLALGVIGLRAVADSWRGLPRPDRLGVRRLVMASCGASLVVTAGLSSAWADSGDRPGALPDDVTSSLRSLSGLPLPDRALSSATRSTGVRATPHRSSLATTPTPEADVPRSPQHEPRQPRSMSQAPRAAGHSTGEQPLRASSGTVRVRAGDSLWRIAAAHLPASAAAWEVALFVNAMQALNPDGLAGDPDLIHPGLIVRLPPPRQPGSRAP